MDTGVSPSVSPPYPYPVTAESAVQEKVWEACQEGDLPSVNSYLNSPEHKRNVDSWFHPEFKQNALHIASLHGHVEVVEALVKTHKVNPNTQTAKLKKTALHLACDECHEPVIRVLLENGADPNLSMLNLQTPLHRATRWGNVTILKVLIAKGGRLNDQDEDGNTALHIAAGIGRPTMVKLLVDKGTDTRLRNKKGKTAHAIAKEKGFYVSQHYLENSSQQSHNVPARTCYFDSEQLVTGKSSPHVAVQVIDDEQRNQKKTGTCRLDMYPMTSSSPGHCIIINNVDFVGNCLARRDGSEQDATALREVFSDLLGFRCHVMKNLTARRIKEAMATFREMDHSECSCLVVAILSHGSEEGILGVDGKSVTVETITSYFVTSECKTLANKPKIFIFQACRGARRETAKCTKAGLKNPGDVKEDSPSDKDMPAGFVETEKGTTDSYFKVIPNMADYVLAYSTMPGYVSYRDNQCGSWFIQHLSEAIRELTPTESFLDILTEVNRRVAMETSDELEVQIPSPQFSLRFKLFLPVQPKPQIPVVTVVAKPSAVTVKTSQGESQLVCPKSSYS